jgi:hypothetical protein
MYFTKYLAAIGPGGFGERVKYDRCYRTNLIWRDGLLVA